MARESVETGQATLLKLAAQTETMQKIDEDLDKMNESLSRSERLIRRMRSIFWGRSAPDAPKRPKAPRQRIGKPRPALGDTPLDQLDDLLGRLKEQAEQASRELRVQDALVDHLSARMDSTEARAKQATRNTRRIS